MEQVEKYKPKTGFTCPNNIVIYGFLLISSLLIMRILTMIFPHILEIIPLRITLLVGIVFSCLIPILIVYKGFSAPSLLISFIVPFVIRAALYPFFKAISLGCFLLMVYPPFIIPSITVGIALGMIGCGSYFKKKDPVLAPICLIGGFLMIVLSTPNLIPLLGFIVSGNYQILETIPNFF